MTNDEYQSNLHKEKARYNNRGLLVLIVSAISGWGVYSLIIEMGMQPRAIWFLVATAITFLWLDGLNRKIYFNAEQKR